MTDKTRRLVCFILFVLLLSALFASCTDREQEDGSFSANQAEIIFMDVGQGDCAVIRNSAGEYMIIDAGTSDNELHLKNDLKRMGISRFEYAVFTHPHEDHIGGADMILSEFEVGTVIIPYAQSSSVAYQKLLEILELKKKTPEKASVGSSYPFGQAKFYVLAPLSEEYREENNYSVVVRLEFGKKTALFTGDIDALVEEELLAAYPEELLKCDILKVAHHGSATSSQQAFLSAACPSYAVISVSEANAYGLPSSKTVRRLQENGAAVYQTYVCGNIRMILSDDKIQVVTERE